MILNILHEIIKTMTGKETIGDNHSAAECTADTNINSGMEENSCDSKERLDAYYSSCLSAAEAQLKELGERGRMLVTAEILLFLAAASFVAVRIFLFSSQWWLWAAAAVFALYLVARHFDVVNDRLKERLQSLRKVAENEKKGLDGDFSVFDDGARYADMHNEYTFDLDVFGRDSLFNRISRCVTTGGADELARQLSSVGKAGMPPAELAANISMRQQAVAEMAGKRDFRQRFISLGAGGLIPTVRIVDALESVSVMNVSSRAAGTAALAAAVAAIAAFWLSVVCAVAGIVPGMLPVWWALIQLVVVIGLNCRSLAAMQKAVETLHDGIRAYIGVIELLTSETFTNKFTLSQQEKLRGAEDCVRGLDKLIDGLDRRNSFLGIVLFNVFGLTDFFLVRHFMQWEDKYLKAMRTWAGAVSSIDALVSEGTMMFNHPAAKMPVVTDDAKLVYQARELWHPFLGSGAKKNDFTIADRSYYIVTGANMAGKSTFLRALGVNYVLALTGMPVFAAEMRVSCVRLFSSMRTQDDLTHGISYFNAELLRLKQLIDYVDSGSRPTLLILDEILKGTNSQDKLNGSRMFLKAMSAKNAAGVIATHDLELSKMADENPEQFHNYCFEIKIGENVTYDYRITPGVARNQNATFLLGKLLGK